MTPERANQVYDILIEECGAPVNGRISFVHNHSEDFREYRFQGSLGFGGKLYGDHRKLWVSCYREDETPERLAMIERANKRLEGLR